MSRTSRLLAITLIASIGLAVLYGLSGTCLSARVRWGLRVDTCPAGTPVAHLAMKARRLQPGAPGEITLRVTALYTEGDPTRTEQTPLDAEAITLALSSDDDTWPLAPDEWVVTGEHHVASVTLPELADGDYTLSARIDTSLGPAEAAAPLAFFSPAFAHVITDRPIYQPGQLIRFRAAIWRQEDRTPLVGRPGRLQVESPSGATLLDESAPSGPFGISASDFPLADGAELGTYTVRYISASTESNTTVTVEPFTVPRRELDVKTPTSWTPVGEAPVITGTVRSAAGGPIADTAVEVTLTGDGSWPLPLDWSDPHALRTDAAGRFSLTLSAVPEDLHRHTTVAVIASAADPAGGTVSGQTSLVLSTTDITAVIETESGGLVADLSNRVYVRVTTPDGRPLPGAEVRVRRAWDPDDPGAVAIADADAVASLQLDPGQPISVVIPPRPRRQAREPTASGVRRTALIDLYRHDRGAPEAVPELLTIDRWAAALEPCAIFVERGTAHATAAVVVAPSGRVDRVLHAPTVLDTCAAEALRRQRATPGGSRLYRVTWALDAVDGPQLTLSREAVIGAVPAALDAALERGRLAARPCILDRAANGPMSEVLHAAVADGASAIRGRWIAAEGSDEQPPAERACLRAAFADLALTEPAAEDIEAVIALSVKGVTSDEDTRTSALPEARVRTAYELAVSARLGREDIGATTVVVSPGSAPALRLRPESAIIDPGGPVSIAVIRGPDFSGTLPDDGAEIALRQLGRDVTTLVFDAEQRRLSGALPGDARGLFEVALAGARAVLWAPRPDRLSVEITPSAQRLAPGDTVQLTVQTRAGAAPSPAAVTLIGVDQALGQVAALPGPTALEATGPKVTSRGRAFGAFDTQKVIGGRVRGENAIAATLLRTGDLPAPASIGARTASASGDSGFDPLLPLVEAFYAILADAAERVARWEADAAPDDQITPEAMVALWGEVLADRQARGAPAEDAFGLPLELSRLPDDLLALTDPRLLIADARHLPEDVEDWTGFVRRSR